MWGFSDLEAWSLNNVTVPITIQYQVPAELEDDVLGQCNQDTEGLYLQLTLWKALGPMMSKFANWQVELTSTPREIQG